MKFPFDTKGLAFVIEVRGSNGPLVSDLNDEIDQCKDWNTKYGQADSPDSREPTPDTTAGETIAYLQIKKSKYPPAGYSFGRSSRCFVVLPRVGKKGISGIHFRIYISEYGTWMLRNESKNGTMIGGDCVLGSVALRPGLDNTVQVMDIKLSIHILTEWLLPLKGRTPAFPTSSRNSSSGTSSSIFELEPIPEYEAGSNSAYHILEQRITPEGSQYRAIHTLTGRPVVAIRCIGDTKKSQQRYKLISTLSSKTDSIVPYLDFISRGAEDFIMTEYVEGTTLREYCLHGHLEDSELLGLYRQMIDCLCFLQQEGIKHGDIRKGTIIVTQRPFKVCLAGFSISTKIVSPLEVDIADLCRTYRSVALDTPDDSGDSEEGSMRGDPEIAALVRQVLSSAPDRMSAHRIKLHISSLVGDTPGGPFAMVNVARSWQLKIRREGKGVFVEVAALLDRLLAQRRCHHINTPPSESKAFEFFPKFRRRVFDKVEFCTSQQALNFCDAFNLEEFARIIQIEVYKNRAVQSSPVRILEGEQELFQIGYHVSTLMFNLTHIAEVLGWRLAFCKDLSIPPTFQEVYDERWGGTYVDQRFCDSFLRDKHDSIGRSIQQVKAVPNPVLSAQFTSNSPEYILIFTGRLRPSMVAVRRTDSFVNWAPSSENDAKFVSTEESCSKCDAENLPLLKRKLLALREQSRLWFWSSWGPYLETIQNDGSDTEVATDESDDDRSQFKFKLK